MVDEHGYDGQQKDTVLFVTFMAVPLDSKYTDTSFLPNSTDSLCLRVAQVYILRSGDFFVDDNDNENDRTD